VIAIAQDKQQDQWKPESAGELGEGGAFIRCKEGKTGKERCAAGKSGRQIFESFERQGASGQASAGQR
jgi:hypothetical protein